MLQGMRQGAPACCESAGAGGSSAPFVAACASLPHRCRRSHPATGTACTTCFGAGRHDSFTTAALYCRQAEGVQAEVRGRLPPWLTGAYVRNGPGELTGMQHW